MAAIASDDEAAEADGCGTIIRLPRNTSLPTCSPPTPPAGNGACGGCASGRTRAPRHCRPSELAGRGRPREVRMAREGKEWGAVVVMSPSPPRHGARHGGRVNAASFSGGIVAGVAPTPPRFLTPATGFQLRSPSGSRYCQEPVVTHDFLNTRCRRRPNYGEVWSLGRFPGLHYGCDP
uniref:cDNA clone:J013000I09, full insert sequence n=1 Tax=Oryza sativa subsp. japonica TaxID=39947 RepID=B7EA50_ORYSJ|nr:unnamed protein product [Oryza sativa Japonica Group]